MGDHARFGTTSDLAGDFWASASERIISLEAALFGPRNRYKTEPTIRPGNGVGPVTGFAVSRLAPAMDRALCLMHRGRAMKEPNAFVGLDIHEEGIAIAIAEAGRSGEVQFFGDPR